MEFMRLPSSSFLLGHCSMLLFSLLVSVSFVAGARIANSVDPNVITFSRFLLAILVIALVVTFFSDWKFIKAFSLWRSTVLGILISVYFITMFEGLKVASSTSMAIVFTLTPIFAAGFDFLYSGRRMSLGVLLAVSVGAFGAIWVIFDGSLAKVLLFEVGFGEKLFFIGCICHAAYAALIPKLNRGEPAIIQTFGTLLTGLIFVGIFNNQEIWITNWHDLSISTILTLIYLAIFATAFSFFLLQFAAVRLSSVKVMAYTYAIPIWVLVMEITLLNYTWNKVILFGTVLISACLIYLLFNSE